jgi:nicotinate-nucleotide adenylyltransferase
VTVGLLGGAFDPPHMGHVALAREAVHHFELERLIVLVVTAPGHKGVETDGEVRLELARAAFPEHEVEVDPHPRTVDMLRARRFSDPIFLVGADEFADFLAWKEPDCVLDLARLGVATRPGYPRERLDAVLERLLRPEQVLLFEIQPVPVSSSGIRRRVARGQPVGDLVPPAVAREIERLGLYLPGGLRS